VEFYNTVLRGGTLLDGFTAMTASIKTEKYKNPTKAWPYVRIPRNLNLRMIRKSIPKALADPVSSPVRDRLRADFVTDPGPNTAREFIG
jgi:hypothetical protein